MKNKNCILLLLLTLMGHISFAQKHLSPALEPYTENWPSTLLKVLDRAGFEMPGEAAGPRVSNLGASDRNALQLDSTRTFYKFTQPIFGDSTPLVRTLYKYPFADVKIETNFQFNNGQWERKDRSTYFSDSQERLTGVLAEVFDSLSQTFVPASKLEIFPHGNSEELVDSFFTYLWDSTTMDWHLELAARNSFDAQDHLLESVNILDDNGSLVVLKSVHEYDVNGDNHLIREFILIDGLFLPFGRREMDYVDHRPIEVLFLVSDGVSFFPQKRTNYAYTLFGSVRKQMNFEWNASSGNFSLVQTIDYGYDNEQRLASKITASNLLEERDLIIYGYVSGEDLYIEMAFHWDDDLFDWVLDTKKYYYYKGATSSIRPDWTAAQMLQITPNPGVDFVRLNLEDPASLQIYSSNGALVHSDLYSADQLLNLSALIPGLYIIAARTETGLYTGKFVKQ